VGEAVVEGQAPGFPRYCVVRVGGLPVEHLARLRAGRSTAEADAILGRRALLCAEASTLTDFLHDTPGGPSALAGGPSDSSGFGTWSRWACPLSRKACGSHPRNTRPEVSHVPQNGGGA
jgi:hypothetical protein